MERRSRLTFLKSKARFGVLLLVPMASVAQTSDSKAINDLLKEAKAHAVLATNDAELLDSYTRATTISWESHAIKLNSMRDHANNLTKDFTELSSLKAQGSAWQQEAIDRIGPLLQEMSKHLSGTINHLNDNKARVHMPPYREYARANQEYMSRTSQLISDFVEYGETRAKADALEARLEVDTAEVPKP